MLLVIFCTVSNAEDEISIATSIYTHHLNGDETLNENNQGIAVNYNDWMAATFVNSNYKRSWVIARRFPTEKYRIINDNTFLRASFYAGVLYGYEEYMPDLRGWTIAATPSVEIGYKKVSLETMISPAGGGVVSSLIKITF